MAWILFFATLWFGTSVFVFYIVGIKRKRWRNLAVIETAIVMAGLFFIGASMLSVDRLGDVGTVMLFFALGIGLLWMFVARCWDGVFELDDLFFLLLGVGCFVGVVLFFIYRSEPDINEMTIVEGEKCDSILIVDSSRYCCNIVENGDARFMYKSDGGNVSRTDRCAICNKRWCSHFKGQITREEYYNLGEYVVDPVWF